MKRLNRSLLAATIALCLFGSTALAGSVQVFSDWARGDMGTAHNATNGQYIGCWVETDPSGPPLLYCEAFDGATSVAFCYTTNGNLVNTAAGMADSTDIEFGWDDGNVCSFLMVNNFSQFPGRKP
ncbi:MAG: hypothetical protein QOI66_3245 [Myxococcales bacterium]|nr:hypothetical protein [Myxococcales bacterium]